MKGPAPKPTKLKVLEGNRGKRPLNLYEPKPAPIRPSCPSHLSKEAKREWRRMVPQLERLGLLTQIDRAALAAYCQAWGRWVEAERILKEKGPPLYKTKKGNVITSPMLWVANKSLEQMHKFLIEFGMTPASRSRISVKTDNQDSNFEKLLT